MAVEGGWVRQLAEGSAVGACSKPGRFVDEPLDKSIPPREVAEAAAAGAGCASMPGSAGIGD